MVRVRRVALLGYPSVGKSSLAYQFVEKRFSEEYCTTIENHLTHEVSVDGSKHEIHIFDTMGMTELPMLSDEIFTMDGWIFVYSVEEHRSFDVLQAYYDALRVQIQKPTIIVVANKNDLDQREVSAKEGKDLASALSGTYMETSAKDNRGVEDVFIKIVREINKSQAGGEPEKKDCTIL